MTAVTHCRAARLAAHIAPWHTLADARDALDAATGFDLAVADLDALTDLAVEIRAGVSLSPPRRACFRRLMRMGATVAEAAAVFGGDTRLIRPHGDDGPAVEARDTARPPRAFPVAAE